MTSIFGKIGVETPAYQSLKKTDIYEIRRYPAQVRATTYFTDKSLDSPFRTIAGYIFGKNVKNSNEAEKIAMTAPVVTSSSKTSDGGSEKIAMTAPVVTSSSTSQENNTQPQNRMSFIMPAKYQSIKDLPEPLDKERIHLEEIPEQTWAVVTFSGWATEEMWKEQETKLRDAVAKDGTWKLGTRVELMQYNPPWTLPFLRTNEVAVEVSE